MAQAETIPTTTRRGFLSAAAAAAVLPASVAAQQIDPIFAIIERHRTAFNEFGTASIANDSVAARMSGREITPADQTRYEAAAEELDEASDLLSSTAPTTMAGMAAALSWLLEYDKGCTPDTTGQFLETLAQSSLLAGR